MESNEKYDVIVIGGSYAGLSAAMALGRAIRNVLVIDGGKPCNIQTPHSHNFLTQDGNTPASITALGKSQVLAYPTIQFVEDHVTDVKGEDNSFEVTTASGKKLLAKKLLFATGVRDLMPNIDGLADCWGISVIHCPYCHGYEYRGEKTGILANGDIAFEFARLISNWTDRLTIFTNGKSSITDEQKAQLVNRNIEIVEREMQKVEHTNGYLNHVVFTDGTTAKLTALYAKLPFEQHCKIPESLGCSLTEMGHIKVDGFQLTSVPGIYAAGDNTIMMRSIASSVASGAMAGAMINRELISW